MKINGFSGTVGFIVALALAWAFYEAGKRKLLW